MELTKEILEALAAPFDPKEIEWRPGPTSGKRALALAYLEARTVMQRLDDVVGGEWGFSWELAGNGVKGTIFMGDVYRSDVGEGGESEMGSTLKAMVSDAFKRCGVHFGIGRYLYSLPKQWADYDPVKKEFVTAPSLPAWALPKGTPHVEGPTGWMGWPEEKRTAFWEMTVEMNLTEETVCAEFGVEEMEAYTGSVEDARKLLLILKKGITDAGIGIAGIHAALDVAHVCDWDWTVKAADSAIKEYKDNG